MKIKRLLLVLPVIFTLVLSLSCGLVVYADSVQDSPYTGELSDLSCNEKLTDTESIYNATKNAYEARYSSDIELGSMPEFKFESYFYGVKITKYTSTDNYSGQIILLDIVDDTVQYEDDDMIIYNGQSCFYYYFSVENGVFTNANSYSTGYLYQNNKNCNLIYDKANGFYFSQPNATTPDKCKTILENPPSYYYLPVYVDTNLSDFPFAEGTNHSSGGKLDLSVSFTPVLSGSLDRKVNQNGVEAESNYFSMTIKNNSSIPAQFMFAIVPKGNSVNLVAKADYLTGIDTIAVNAVYYFTCNEWIYAPIITSDTTGKNNKLEKIYNQSSAWHLVNGNSTYTRSFNWSQINIQKGVEYDAVVVAIPTQFDKPSRVFMYPANAHYLDVSTGGEIYRSTFSVENPVVYDPNCTEFDNNANSGMLNKDVNNASATMDAETGEVEVKDISSSDYLENAKNWEPGIIEKEVGGLGFSLADIPGSLSGIFSQASSLFGFFGSVFSFMPSWFWSIILLGITSLIVIGVIKALL